MKHPVLKAAFRAASAAAALLAVVSAAGQNAYVQHNLVSDLPGKADNVDTNLVNPWGIAASATSPFWLSDNHSGLSTLYTTTGAVLPLVVSVPPAAGGSPPGSPTGIIFNGTTNFPVAAGAPARFVFATEDGTISGWAAGGLASVKVDNSAAGAVYKGLATASWGGDVYLYAANFHAGTVDVFDGRYAAVTWPGAFVDATLPAGFAPFGIQNIGGEVYVTYAKQDPGAHDDVSGPGNGYVNVFTAGGQWVKRLVSAGPLNSPWGVAKAPQGFGAFGGALLIGNFGDGSIHAFNPVTGAHLGALQDTAGNTLSIPGLWGLAVGNGGRGGDTNKIYFAAGIPGGGVVEDHGLFGSLAPAAAAVTLPQSVFQQRNLVSDLPGVASTLDTNLTNPWGIAASATSPFWLSDNHSGLSTLYDTGGAVLPLVVTVPPPAGGSGPAAPTGIVFNGTTNFLVTAGSPARFIFATEDGTVSAWAGGAVATLKVDNSTNGAVYKGLAEASWGGGDYLYAANFHAGTVDVFDGRFAPVSWPGAFADAGLPAGFAPFGIQAFGGEIFVTYAKQDAGAHDDVSGAGNGFVDVFTAGGSFVKRLISGGTLNSPWGLAQAPQGFGALGNSLLVGNFGDGTIHAFDILTGAPLGVLNDPAGRPIVNAGLWGLFVGNGGRGGDPGSLYFSAGIPGNGAVEDHGLFGSLAPVPRPRVTASVPMTTAGGPALVLYWTGGVPPYRVQTAATPGAGPWADALTTTNSNAVVPVAGGSLFYRIVDVVAGP